MTKTEKKKEQFLKMFRDYFGFVPGELVGKKIKFIVDESQHSDQPPIDIVENRFSEWFGVIDEVFVASCSAIIVPTSRRHIDCFKIDLWYYDRFDDKPTMVIEAIGIEKAINKADFCGPHDIKHSGKLSVVL